jgi:hypothetical protein
MDGHREHYGPGNFDFQRSGNTLQGCCRVEVRTSVITGTISNSKLLFNYPTTAIRPSTEMHLTLGWYHISSWIHSYSFQYHFILLSCLQAYTTCSLLSHFYSSNSWVATSPLHIQPPPFYLRSNILRPAHFTILHPSEIITWCQGVVLILSRCLLNPHMCSNISLWRPCKPSAHLMPTISEPHKYINQSTASLTNPLPRAKTNFNRQIVKVASPWNGSNIWLILTLL